MTIKHHTKDAIAEKTDTLIIPVFENFKLTALPFKTLAGPIKQSLTQLKKQDAITGKSGEFYLMNSLGAMPADHILFVGMGNPKKASPNCFRNAAGAVSRKANSLKLKAVTWDIQNTLPSAMDTAQLAQAIAEGTVLGNYTHTTYKTDAKKTTLKQVTLALPKGTAKARLDQAIKTGQLMAKGTNTARDLANTPANDLTPKHVIDFAKSHFKGKNVKLSVIDKKQAKKLGMGAFLGVAQGSAHDPYILVIDYAPVKGQKPLGLIGKGVTFDTGGISIKPSSKMSEMKGDMGGGAAVIGAMEAIAGLGVKRNILALVPLVENMPSGTAQRPGDVVKAMNGKTIEILNTDAEGRLILADSICYAVQQGVDQLIDIATLTGACLVALGNAASGILGTDQKTIDNMIAAGEFTGDKLWQLPLYDEYLDLLKSGIADLANCYEGRLAGTSTAAMFLQQFTNDIPWVHLDIASTMSSSKTKGYLVKGMTGSGTRNIVQYLITQCGLN